MTDYMPSPPNYGNGNRLLWKKVAWEDKGLRWDADIPGSAPEQKFVIYQPIEPPLRANGKPFALILHQVSNYRVCHHFGYFDDDDEARRVAENHIRECDEREAL